MAELTAQTLIFAALDRACARAREELGCSCDSLLVAVSGGRDSVVLLDALWRSKERLRVSLAVCHVDHGLRSNSSGDAAFVAELAEHYSLPCTITVAPPFPETANIEAWAREIRYRILEQSRLAMCADLVLTAHHADDQAETLLFRVVTGRLATSAHSIQEVSLQRSLLRPLLTISRNTIAAYQEHYKLPCVEDETNLDETRSRNFLRHTVIPVLVPVFGENVSRVVGQVATRLNDDEELLASLAVAHAAQLHGKLKLAQLYELPKPLRWRVLRELAQRELGEPAAKLGYSSLQKVFALTMETVERSLDLGHGVCLKLASDGVVSFHLGVPLKPPARKLAPERITIPGSVVRKYEKDSVEISAKVLAPGEISLEEIRQRSMKGTVKDSAAAYFSAEELDFQQFRVREREDGDSVQVWERGGRKLKKLLQERGLVLTLRDRIPIVECGKKILWVPGVARSDIAPVSENTASILELLYVRRGGFS